MPSRWQIDKGATIAAGQTQQWMWEWFSDAGAGSGDGPNKGPVIFRALPKGPGQGGTNTAQINLVTFDFAKCRGPANGPNGPKVFYEFKIRNDSSIDAPFLLEIVRFDDLPINT